MRSYSTVSASSNYVVSLFRRQTSKRSWTLCEQNVTERQHRQLTYDVMLRSVRESLLPWKSNKYYAFLCVCVCVCVCARVRGCGHQEAWTCACVWVHVVLLVQHDVLMRYIVTSFVAPLAPPYFSTFSHKCRDFREKVVIHRMYVLIFSTMFFETFSHSKKNLARYCQKCRNVCK